MPRVNKDMQRRIVSRRDRPERRPSERRYRFSAEPEVTGEAIDGTVSSPSTISGRDDSVRQTVRGSIQRAVPKAYSEYREEYKYVGVDLRRVAIVVGSLLVLLLALAFLVIR